MVKSKDRTDKTKSEKKDKKSKKYVGADKEDRQFNLLADDKTVNSSLASLFAVKVCDVDIVLKILENCDNC